MVDESSPGITSESSTRSEAASPGAEGEILSQRLRDLIEDILEARVPNAGEFCGNCYHPTTQETLVCPHCGVSAQEVPVVHSIPSQVIEAHRRRRGREALVVRSIAWGGLTIGVTVALLPFVFGNVTLLTAALFFGLLFLFYVGSANLANSVGDALGYRWGRSLFERRWRDFLAGRDRS
jgi:hypothetical protein